MPRILRSFLRLRWINFEIAFSTYLIVDFLRPFKEKTLLLPSCQITLIDQF